MIWLYYTIYIRRPILLILKNFCIIISWWNIKGQYLSKEANEFMTGLSQANPFKTVNAAKIYGINISHMYHKLLN